MLIYFSYIDHIPNDALNVCFPYHRIFQFEKFNFDTNQNVEYNDTDADPNSNQVINYSKI